MKSGPIWPADSRLRGMSGPLGEGTGSLLQRLTLIPMIHPISQLAILSRRKCFLVYNLRIVVQLGTPPNSTQLDPTRGVLQEDVVGRHDAG